MKCLCAPGESKWKPLRMEAEAFRDWDWPDNLIYKRKIYYVCVNCGGKHWGE